MDRKNMKPMTPFDSLVTPPYLYTMKLLLPYTPSASQHMLAVYIKFLELKYTMESFRHFPMNPGKEVNRSSSPFGMFEDLMPYMEPGEKSMMEQMSGMMNMMELMRQFQSAGGEGDSGSSGFNPMDMMKGMFSQEQQDMFKMYSEMFDSDLDGAYSDNNREQDRKDGDRPHERMDESPGDEEY